MYEVWKHGVGQPSPALLMRTNDRAKAERLAHRENSEADRRGEPRTARVKGTGQ